MKTAKLDHRRKYYLILDCETATLPFAENYSGPARQKISIAKPLIYDLGWTVVDRQGRIYRRKSFLITEIFSVPSIFNTAYYKEKRPLYLEALANDETILTDWKTATAELVEDMAECVGVGAYNAMFDFKKAIPFTELYINNLYSADFQKWLDIQEKIICNIASGRTYTKEKTYEPEVFRFREKVYPLFDVWGLSCSHLLNNDDYKETCVSEGWTTPSGKYYKTSAETAFRFVAGDNAFEEAHTALNDAEIESFLFGKIGQKTKGKFEWGIVAFPFRILGTIE